jgi:hypothetical protein
MPPAEETERVPSLALKGRIPMLAGPEVGPMIRALGL